MAAEYSSGTQAATAATEHTISANPETTDGTYMVFVDTSALTGVNTLRLRIYEKVISSGSERLVWDFTYGAGGPMPPSPALILLHGWRVSITSTQGSINIPWSIRSA